MFTGNMLDAFPLHNSKGASRYLKGNSENLQLTHTDVQANLFQQSHTKNMVRFNYAKENSRLQDKSIKCCYQQCKSKIAIAR